MRTCLERWLSGSFKAFRIASLVTTFMKQGDYDTCTAEAALLYHPERVGRTRPGFGVDRLAVPCEELGFLVDTGNAAAFSANMTTSPNGWLVNGLA
jgi:hypothetical protein